ncbi:NAD(P)H nitroreductase [Nocardia sp. NPDC049190]|uniref:Acg family FMN-binding oxidoreductase n=1 Tax=Nocardia sp. NPDC049190 TaxID=3155650 RepID=UPI0033CBFBAB
MYHELPDDNTIHTALELALRAPSVHNVQPWRWRITDRSVHLDLDPTRAPPYADPVQRDLVLSCGAALHHLNVAFAALGWSAVVHRLPNPVDPNHLAAIELVRHRPTPLDIALSAAIAQRRTDRRHYASWPIPPGYLGLVTERAAALGAIVRQAADPAHDHLAEAIRKSAARHATDPDNRYALSDWSDRRNTAGCVPAEDTPSQGAEDELPVGDVATPPLVDNADETDYAKLLVLGTSALDRLSRLRAGEAMSAVLLTATNVGLATCALTEPLEIADVRRMVRRSILYDIAYPQVVIRIGWAPISMPTLPRRLVEDVVEPTDRDPFG